MTYSKIPKNELLLFLTALVAVGIGFYYFAPSITGFVIKELSYSQEPNLVVASSGNYTLHLGNIGSLSSIKLDGRVTNYGKARVYIESNGIRYLIFDSARLNESQQPVSNDTSLITGFAVKGPSNISNASDEDRKKKNKKPEWIGPDEFVINGTTILNLSQYFKDNDNDPLIFSASEVEGLKITTNNEIVEIKPITNENFNTTMTFTATDGIDARSHVVGLIVIVEKGQIPESITENITKINHEPKWISGINSFMLNKTLSIDLLQYFSDENNDTLAFSVSDVEYIAENINASVLTLSAEKENFNSTLAITASDGNLSSSKEITLIIPLTPLPINKTNQTIINETKAIAINLEYKAGTIYDANDNGEESINGVVDLTVENTKFGWNADQSRLCTRWEIYSIEDEKSTTLCYGNNDCCAFVGLLPSKTNWNEVYYSTYGKDGSSHNNIISSQVLYYDVNLSAENPKSEIYYSEWGNKSVKFFEEETEFFDKCIESCTLSGLNKRSYSLIFEIEDNAVLRIDKIKYNLLVDVVNNAPLLLKNFSTINLSKNRNLTINLSEYFYDQDGDILTYGYYKMDNISILFDSNYATIVPDKDFEGARFTFISANDSEIIAASNVFEINVFQSGNLPTVNLTAAFVIVDSANNKLAAIDSLGNLNIKGHLTQNAEPVADQNYFVIQDKSGITNAVVTNPEGDLLLKGTLSEDYTALMPTPNSFIIQDKNNETVAYFNSTGSLFLKGAVTENVLFEYSKSR